KLAHHYGRSANREKAFDYTRLAGKSALARYAYQEAIGQLRAALELLGQLPSERPRDELDIQLAVGNALAATRGRGDPDTGAAYSRARDLCTATNAPAATTFEVLQGVVINLFEKGESRLAQETAEEMLAVTERSGDEVLIGQAHDHIGLILMTDQPAKARPY